jgi:hypothetical protein
MRESDAQRERRRAPNRQRRGRASDRMVTTVPASPGDAGGAAMAVRS